MNLRLECPECKAKIKYKDINVNKALAKCDSCHTVHSFEKKEASATQQKTFVALPEGIRAYDMPDAVDFEVSWKKSSKSLWFFTAFAIFWNTIVGIFVIIGFATGEMTVLAFIAFHIIVGLGVAYYVLALFFNTSYIGINRYDLTVEHSPIPFPFFKSYEISVQDIEQLHIERYVASKTNGRPDYAFSVFVKTRNKVKPIKLMKGLKTAEQGRYIEQEIESFLGIEDEKVTKEWT